MNRTARWAGLAMVIAGLFVWKYLSLNVYGPSDQQLIREALNQAIEASREGRPGGVMELLGDKFHVNSDLPTSGQVADFIKSGRPDVSVPETSAFVSGDSARLTAPVRVKFSYLGINLDQTVKDVTLEFTREPAHEWVLVPYHRWKLTGITVPEQFAPSNLGS